MKNHLYEFRSQTKKLKCMCGWEKTMRSSNIERAYKAFEIHRAKAAALS